MNICKNDRCSNIVAPSKNPGAVKLYCSARCGRRYHARQHYAREAGSVGAGLLGIVEGRPFVNRDMPKTKQAAEKRYKDHLEDCEFSTTGGMCPARFDAYNTRRVCLVKAIFAEDWEQLMYAEEGQAYTRVSTSEDGFWMMDKKQLLEAGVNIPVRPSSSRDVVEIASRERDAFIAAGGAKPDASLLS